MNNFQTIFVSSLFAALLLPIAQNSLFSMYTQIVLYFQVFVCFVHRNITYHIRTIDEYDLVKNCNNDTADLQLSDKRNGWTSSNALYIQ